MLALDPWEGWLFLAGGGWVQRARLDASEPALLYNGTALADIAVDVQVLHDVLRYCIMKFNANHYVNICYLN